MTMLPAGTKAPALDPIANWIQQGPVLLAFFKVSCPTCQLAAPFLDRISKGILKVVGISQDPADLTKTFADRFGANFETILDPAADGYVLSNAFGITNVPSLFLIEADGTISHASHGFDKAELEQLGQRAGVQVFQGEKVPNFKPG